MSADQSDIRNFPGRAPNAGGQDLRLAGKPAAYLPTVESILDHVVAGAKEGDVVCVFSNGGFGGIHDRLLGRLAG